MPELPEVETMRRGLQPIVGRRIERIEKPRSPYKPLVMRPGLAVLRRRLVGQRIVEVGRLGKRLVFRTDGDDRLVVHPRMAGIVLLDRPPDERHVRLRIWLAGRPAHAVIVWDRRGLGTVELFTDEQFARWRSEGSVGPDALEITLAQFRQRLQSSRREVKVALLDQRAVAGIGNLYASEILHVARIHPRQRCNRLDAEQWRRLHRAMRCVLREAIRLEGSTLADGTYRSALNREGGYQSRHRVYQKAGQVCPSCRQARIEWMVQGQRSTFFCPRCQPLR